MVLAEWLCLNAANADVTTVQGSIPASIKCQQPYDTIESEGGR
jgi:hypothetical protein